MYTDRDVTVPSDDRPRRRRAPSLPRSQSIYEWIALGLTALPMMVGPWLFGAVRIWSVAPLVVSVMLGAIMALARPFFFRGVDALRWPPGWPLLAAFAVYAAARSPSAAVPYDAWFQVLSIVSYVAAWWVWTTLAAHNRRWRVVVCVFMLSVTFMAWYALVQHSQGSRMVLNVARPDVYGMRASGAYICPNHFANLLEMVAAAGLALACCGTAGAVVRMLGGYAVLISLPAVFLTQSRSGWLAMAVGLAVAACITAWRRSTRLFVAALVAAPVLASLAGWTAWNFSTMVRDRVQDALSGNVRISLWQDTWAMIQDSPIWGHGPGSYRWVYPSFKHHMTAYLDPQFPHNDLLLVLADYGAVGAAVLLLALGVAVFALLIRVRKLEREKDAALVAAFVAALAASVAHSMFDFNLQIFANVHVLVMLGGLVGAALSASDQLRSVEPPRAVGFSLRTAGVAGALVVIVFAVMAFVSYMQSRWGDEHSAWLRYDAARARYDAALRVDPRDWKPWLGLGHLLSVQAKWNRDPEARMAQIREAQTAYEEALRRNPWHTEATHGLSKLYAMKGDQQKSRELMEDLVRRVPYHWYYLTELGARLRDMGLYREALDRFIEAQRIENARMIELNIQLLQEKLAAQQGGGQD